MGDAGKVCFSKASSTAGRVAHKATNGRVIYKRAKKTDPKHAKVTIVFSPSQEGRKAFADASWSYLSVGNTDISDYTSEGLHSIWSYGIMEYIEYAHPNELSFEYHMWLSEYPNPGSWTTAEFRLFIGSGFLETRYADVTIEQENEVIFSERVDVSDSAGIDPTFTIDFDSDGKAFRVNISDNIIL